MPFDLLNRVLAALEGYTRQLVIDALRRRPRSVAEIHQVLLRSPKFTPSRPAISQALAVLLRARLVKRRVEGRRHIYQLDRTGFDVLRDYLERLESLPGFRS
jgi:DNA-binding transcriptional ArsR family regulator